MDTVMEVTVMDTDIATEVDMDMDTATVAVTHRS